MYRKRSLLVACLAVVSVSCAATVGPPPVATGGAPGPGPGAVAAPMPAGGGYGPGEDAHWIQPDDFFVADKPLEGAWVWVALAKMKQAPSTQTKEEALFFMVGDGKDQWSRHFYRTRPAAQADLVMGNMLICFDGNKQGNVYRGPRDKDNARAGRWWLARITDLSDMYKGVATLAGSYHCAPEALRAVVVQ